MPFELDAEHIAAGNRKKFAALEDDYDHLGRQLARRGIDIDGYDRASSGLSRVGALVGRRHRRHPVRALPRARRAPNVFEKVEDCEVVFKLIRSTPGISLHIPWDKPDSAAELRSFAHARGLYIDSMNSNTFQDQPGQPLSYKFGSLTHTDPAVRRQAIQHNLECLELGEKLGSPLAHRLDR